MLQNNNEVLAYSVSPIGLCLNRTNGKKELTNDRSCQRQLVKT